ncbi:MAG: SCP-like extracellular protein [Devosia sp.]|uniref:CAP domain-containing protein n=1 Tax=Devosia sp. TaxID=1871048 RepID=UPI00261482C1|nr:CAP domain-containing protein [Devosia sp.]MDB5539463.1 SCP-like extracellular protein [Devosia sp.]
MFHKGHAALARFAVVAALAGGLAACSMGGGGGGQLSAGLTAPMNAPGAKLNRVEALFLLNDFRRSQGAADVRGDTVLDGTAQSLATNYAKTGAQPILPPGAVVMRLSAGYTTFAEAFSGWRNVPADAAAISDATAKRAGLGVAYDPNSTHGVYWVLVLDD